MKLYRQMIDDLTRVYPEGEARALVRRMLEDGFGLSQTDVLLGKDSELSADDLTNAREIVTRLLHHEPIQYILGFTDFCGHRFRTAPGALIPRPETQQLVSLVTDWAMRSLPVASPSSVPASFSSSASSASPSSAPVSFSSSAPAFSGDSVPAGSPGGILDIGTGTGCIALSLALALPDARVTAWDVSAEALSVARHNASFYPEACVTLEQADILAPPADDRRWQVIVSNPPYVRQSEACQMEQNVLRYEPHCALFVPDDDPLRFYRAIGLYAQSHLVSGGMLFLEINHALSAETAHLIEDFGFRDVRVEPDSFGLDRFVIASQP